MKKFVLISMLAASFSALAYCPLPAFTGNQAQNNYAQQAYQQCLQNEQHQQQMQNMQQQQLDMQRQQLQMQQQQQNGQINWGILKPTQ